MSAAQIRRDRNRPDKRLSLRPNPHASSLGPRHSWSRVRLPPVREALFHLWRIRNYKLLFKPFADKQYFDPPDSGSSIPQWLYSTGSARVIVTSSDATDAMVTSSFSFWLNLSPVTRNRQIGMSNNDECMSVFCSERMNFSRKNIKPQQFANLHAQSIIYILACCNYHHIPF